MHIREVSRKYYHSMVEKNVNAVNDTDVTQLFVNRAVISDGRSCMMKFLLWLIVLFLCWPLALLALVLYPIVWLLLLPFRIIGIAVDGVLQLLKAVILLPARILRGSPAGS